MHSVTIRRAEQSTCRAALCSAVWPSASCSEASAPCFSLQLAPVRLVSSTVTQLSSSCRGAQDAHDSSVPHVRRAVQAGCSAGRGGAIGVRAWHEEPRSGTLCSQVSTPHSSRRTCVQQHLHGCEVPRPGSVVDRRVPTAACTPQQALGVQSSLKHSPLCIWMSTARTAGAIAMNAFRPLRQQPRQLLCVASLRHGAGALCKLYLFQAL